MHDTAIKIENLHVTLRNRAGAVDILRGIDLTVKRGETLALIGPSGSGKSTLLMVLAGLEPPTQGHIMVDGFDYSTMSEDALARFRRRHIGIVFQSFHLVPTMTALENVALPLELAGETDMSQAEKLLNEVGLGARHTHYPAQLSGGEQQRVAIARALVANPPVLFADEPTGNLDLKTGAAIMDLIMGLAAQRDTTLLLITHDVELANRASRILTMRDGCLEAAP